MHFQGIAQDQLLLLLLYPRIHLWPQMRSVRSRMRSKQMMIPTIPYARYPSLTLDLMKTKMRRRRIWAALQLWMRSKRLLRPKRQVKRSTRTKTTITTWRNTIYLMTIAPTRTPARRQQQLLCCSPTMTMCNWFPQQLRQLHRQFVIETLLNDELGVAVAAEVIAAVIPTLKTLPLPHPAAAVVVDVVVVAPIDNGSVNEINTKIAVCRSNDDAVDTVAAEARRAVRGTSVAAVAVAAAVEAAASQVHVVIGIIIIAGTKKSRFRDAGITSGMRAKRVTSATNDADAAAADLPRSEAQSPPAR